MPEDMVLCKNCWTLEPNAFTMWLGRPRDWSRSVKRLNSADVSLSEDSADSISENRPVVAPTPDVPVAPVVAVVVAGFFLM